MRNPRSATFVILSLLAAACSSGTTPPADGRALDGGPLDAKADGQSTDGGCTETLSQTGCPATYEDAVSQCKAEDAAASSPNDQSRAGSCGSQLIYEQSTPFSPNYCAYDATSHQLVGALLQSDTARFCGDSSMTVGAGQIDTSCTFSKPDCAPSGAADASAE